MLRLTENEVRAITSTPDIPDIHEGNCRPGVTPDEIRRLIAETRMSAMGGDIAIKEYRRQHPELVEKTVDDRLASVSVF
jgi:hypothetical protein